MHKCTNFLCGFLRRLCSLSLFSKARMQTYKQLTAKFLNVMNCNCCLQIIAAFCETNAVFSVCAGINNKPQPQVVHPFRFCMLFGLRLGRSAKRCSFNLATPPPFSWEIFDTNNCLNNYPSGRRSGVPSNMHQQSIEGFTAGRQKKDRPRKVGLCYCSLSHLAPLLLHVTVVGTVNHPKGA